MIGPVNRIRPAPDVWKVTLPLGACSCSMEEAVTWVPRFRSLPEVNGCSSTLPV